jgi:hypothetical protein
MKQPLFKKNTAINHERIEFIELVVSRLARRTRKVAKAIITPYPISNAVIGEGLVGKSLEGVILRYMFPCSGKITRGYIKLDKKPKDGVEISVGIFNETISESKGFTVDKKTLAVDTSLDVKPGDCLEVILKPKGESVVGEVWISMLWVPTTGDVEQFLIEELEKNIEEVAEEILQ